MTRHALPLATEPTAPDTPFDFEASSLVLFRRLRGRAASSAGDEGAPALRNRAAATARLARIGEAGNDPGRDPQRARRLAA